MPSLTIQLAARPAKLLAERAKTSGYSLREYVAAIVVESVSPRTVTINDVAAAAKVSKQAVSFALNGFDDEISVETKKRILAAAKRLGYKPSIMARSFRKRQS